MEEDGGEGGGCKCEEEESDESDEEAVVFVDEAGDDADGDEEPREDGLDGAVLHVVGAVEPGVEDDDVDEFSQLEVGVEGDRPVDHWV